MGPVRQNPIQRTVSLFICVRIALCTIVAHNIAQNRPDSFPPLLSRRSPLLGWCLFEGRGDEKTKAIARVHPVHLMNADWAPGGRQPSDQSNWLGLKQILTTWLNLLEWRLLFYHAFLNIHSLHKIWAQTLWTRTLYKIRVMLCILFSCITTGQIKFQENWNNTKDHICTCFSICNCYFCKPLNAGFIVYCSVVM